MTLEVPIETQKVAADHAKRIWEALHVSIGADGEEIAPMIMALNHVSAKLSDYLCSQERDDLADTAT